MRIVVLSAIFALISFGCGSGPREFVRPELDQGSFKRVAVLPLDNFTDDRLAGEKIRRAIIVELLARGTDVVEPGEVNSVLLKMQVQNLHTFTRQQLTTIGNELKVNSLIAGSVSDYGMKRGAKSSFPEISLYLVMYDASSGNVLWSVWHTTGGPGFWQTYLGTEEETLSEAVRKIVHQAVRSWP